MYEAHFGLSSDPFRLNPASTPKFEHKTYSRARAYMFYALERREGVLLLTGTPGTGKTSVARDFVSSIEDPELVIEQIVCASLDGEDLLRAVALRFGVDVVDVKKAMLYERIVERLTALADHGRRAVLIIDDAQGLTYDALEEVRTLCNLQRGDDALLQIFLIGQPSLRTTIRSAGLEQLHQRLIVACQIDSLGIDDVESYVHHCLTHAGMSGPAPFEAPIYAMVHAESSGIARRINLIMSRLLLHGMVHEKTLLTVADARAVLDSMREDGLLSPKPWRSGVTDDDQRTSGQAGPENGEGDAG